MKPGPMADGSAGIHDGSATPGVPPSSEKTLGTGTGGGVADSSVPSLPEGPPGPPPEEMSQQIVVDAQQSEQLVEAAATTRRSEIDGQFGVARAHLIGLVDNTSAQLQGSVAAREAEFASASGAVSVEAQTAVTNTIQAAQGQVGQAQTTLTGMSQTATGAAQASVSQVTGQLEGLASSLPLPDLPGVGLVRSGVRALVGRAGAMLTRGLDRVRSLIGSAMTFVAALLSSALTAVGQATRSVLGRLSSVLRQAGTALFSALRRATRTVTDGVRQAITVTVLAGLTRLRTSMTGNLSTATRHAVAAIRRNRDDHLLAVRTGGAGPSIVDDAAQQSASIVATFRERTGTIIGQALSLLSVGTAALVGRIGQAVSQVITTVRDTASQVLGRVREIGQAVTGFLSELLGQVGTVIRQAVETVRALIDNPVQALSTFASGAVERVGQFLRGVAQRVLGGDFSMPNAAQVIGEDRLSSGPITPPPRGPITLPGLRTILIVFALVGALVAYVAPQLVVVVAAALAALGITVSPIVLLAIVGVVVILAVIVILLLLYLLYQALKPKPPGCTITTKTVAAAPDGTADTRRTVGVSEVVTLTSSAPATWSASTGTLTPTGPSSATWTAPGTPATATITATPTSGGAATATIKVLQPTGNIQSDITPQGYAPDRAGSGFVSKVTVQPTSVSFSRIKVREETATGNATGYYDTVMHWKGIQHPQGTFMPLDRNNNGQTDTVGSVPPGTPTPFSKGDFHWPIPQSYESPSGAAVVYSTGDHLQEMTGVTGEETTSKESASNTRTPTSPPPPPTPAPGP